MIFYSSHTHNFCVWLLINKVLATNDVRKLSFSYFFPDIVLKITWCQQWWYILAKGLYTTEWECSICLLILMTHPHSEHFTDDARWHAVPTSRLGVRIALPFLRHYLVTDSGLQVLMMYTTPWRQVRCSSVVTHFFTVLNSSLPLKLHNIKKSPPLSSCSFIALSWIGLENSW